MFSGYCEIKLEIDKKNRELLKVLKFKNIILHNPWVKEK